MNSISATIRETKTRGDINSLRINGNIPAVIYGGSAKNQKITLSKKELKILINNENFLSTMITLNIGEKNENVLPREISFDPVTDEPIHIDFLRVLKDGDIVLEIPVKFINNDKSPGLKRGGVLNIVRRKVELKCPTGNIPKELIVDLENKDIGESFKISSIKLPEGVKPTIQDRDFVVATLAAPTIIKEPEKPAEEAVEGAEGTEGATEVTAEGAAKPGEAKAGETKATEDDKGAKKEDKKTPDKGAKVAKDPKATAKKK